MTDLSFIHHNKKDQIFYTELSYNKISWVTLTLVNVYSFEAESSFVEFSIKFDILVKNDRIGLSPFILSGFDFWFVEDTNGLKNIQAGAIYSYQLYDNLSLNVYIASSYGAWDEATNENNTWVGVSISTDF